MPLSDAKAGGTAQSILARMTASDPADMKGDSGNDVPYMKQKPYVCIPLWRKPHKRAWNIILSHWISTEPAYRLQIISIDYRMRISGCLPIMHL